jgi:hypothetical protein
VISRVHDGGLGSMLADDWNVREDVCRRHN